MFIVTPFELQNNCFQIGPHVIKDIGKTCIVTICTRRKLSMLVVEQLLPELFTICILLS